MLWRRTSPRGKLVTLEVRDFPPLHRDSALVRRGRATPLSPAAAHFVEAVRAQAARLGLLAPGQARDPKRRGRQSKAPGDATTRRPRPER